MIQNEPINSETVIVSIRWTGIPNHEIIKKGDRICGKDRIKLGFKLACNGISNVESEHIIYNHLTDEPSNIFKKFILVCGVKVFL